MPRSVQDFDIRGGRSKEANLPDQNAQRLEQTAHALTTKTGFGLTPAVTLSFVDGTRTFTITPTGSTFEYWIQGVKYTKTIAESVVITDTEGLWYIYYVGNTLTTSQTLWITKEGDKTMVATIHWDATNNTAIVIGYEVHSHEMSPGTHNYLHETIGTNYEEGLGLTEGSGGTAGQIGIAEGEVHDEDIEINITDGAGGSLWEQVLTLPAQIPVYYRSGATAWRKYTANNYPWYDNSGVDRIHYNKLNGTWASVEATNPYYVAYWLFATNDIAEPIIAIMGQREDLLLADTLDNNQIENLSFGTLPFSEMKILYRLIWKSATAPAVADDIQDLRSVSNVPGGTYVPTPTPTLSQVVAIGDTLLSGQKIDSADENLEFIFGRCRVGRSDDNAAHFGYRGFTAIKQNSVGRVDFNAAGGQSLYFNIALTPMIRVTTSVMTMSVPIAMGTNKITGLTAGASSGEAVEFDQITEHDALKIQGVDVDDTDIGANKILKYNSSSGNLEYEDIAGATDADAIHDNVANEITAITPKTTPADADEFVMEDSAASFVKKAITYLNLKTALQAHAPASHDFDVHTGDVDLADLAAGSQGSMIRRGASDWEELIKGTLNYVLKAGATDIDWGQVDWSELSGSQPSPIAHVLATSGPHTGTLPWDEVSKTGSSLADLATKNHAQLDNKNAETDFKHLTDAQQSALHDIYSLETHAGSHQNGGGDEISVGGLSGLLADGQTPISHNNTYHSTNYLANISEDTSPEMLIEDALAVDGAYEGMVLTITNTQTFGLAVYISGNNIVGLADKDSITTMPPIGISVGTNKVLIQGTVREDDWNWTANDKIFVGDDGALTNDVSGFTTGDIVHCIGVANDPNTISVKQMDWIEITAGLFHNDLSGLNAGDSYEHITQTQKDALHDIYSLETHAGSHQNGGGDEINVGGLSGLLADGQTPLSHALDSHSVPTGSIAMSSQKFTGLAAGSVAGESVRYEQLHSETHILATSGPHTGTLPWGEVSKTSSSLADLATRTHTNLSDAPTSAHHVKYTDAEVQALSINAVVDDTAPQLGGPLDLNDKGVTHELVAAVSLVNGDLCYMNGSGKMAKAQGDAEATCDTLLAMCLDTISADATGTFLLWGKYTTSGLTAGVNYYVSDITAGAITLTKPSTVGDIIRLIGTSVSTTILFFKPSTDYIEYV